VLRWIPGYGRGNEPDEAQAARAESAAGL